MYNIDMVFFPGSSSDLQDLYSTGYRTPSADSSNSYLDTRKTTANGVHSYVTYREMDTGDSNDFVVECGMTHKFAWVGSSSSSNLVKHNQAG
jgi:hypothetical protein